MKTSMRGLRTALILFASLAACALGCQSSTTEPAPTASNLTAGMAKRTIAKGQTRQVEVMEVFGPPDLLTRNGSGEVWTYDKVRYDVESSEGYLTVLLAGASGSRVSSSSTSTMLIVYFDQDDVVRDYRMSVTRF